MCYDEFTRGHLMEIKWLVADITSVGSPDIAERAILAGGDFGWALFWPIQAIFVDREPLCGVGTPLLSPNKFIQDHLMKLEWLVTNVTSVGFPDIAEHAIFGVILGAACPAQGLALALGGAATVGAVAPRPGLVPPGLLSTRQRWIWR